jgi:hypothetical protein
MRQCFPWVTSSSCLVILEQGKQPWLHLRDKALWQLLHTAVLELLLPIGQGKVYIECFKFYLVCFNLINI